MWYSFIWQFHYFHGFIYFWYYLSWGCSMYFFLLWLWILSPLNFNKILFANGIVDFRFRQVFKDVWKIGFWKCLSPCELDHLRFWTDMVCFLQLLGLFDSERARTAAMSDLHHRILPPNFLSENPREAGYCLWLLHPEPASRPSAR